MVTMLRIVNSFCSQNAFINWGPSVYQQTVKKVFGRLIFPNCLSSKTKYVPNSYNFSHNLEHHPNRVSHIVWCQEYKNTHYIWYITILVTQVQNSIFSSSSSMRLWHIGEGVSWISWEKPTSRCRWQGSLICWFYSNYQITTICHHHICHLLM